MTGQYRRRATDFIDAWQVDMDEDRPVPKWLESALAIGLVEFNGGSEPFFFVTTGQGRLRARPGMWILRHAGGKMNVFADDAFQAAYELAA